MQCELNALTDEQKNELKKNIESILKELEKFKKEKGITADCKPIYQDKDGKLLSVSITLPTPELNEAFLVHLNSKNLLCTSIMGLQAEKLNKPEEEQRSTARISPLRTKPKVTVRPTTCFRN